MRPPFLATRVALEWPWFSAGAFGVFDKTLGHGAGSDSLQTWAFGGELRLHTSGDHQFSIGVGAGWGQLVEAQPGWASGNDDRFSGQAAPYVQASIGYRFCAGPAAIGVEIGLQRFNRVRFNYEFGNPQLQNGFSLLALMLAVGWRGGEL